VNLSNPVNAVFSRSQGIGTILNDEPLPSITINDVSVIEGNSGTANATSQSLSQVQVHKQFQSSTPRRMERLRSAATMSAPAAR
jgi:hypothetical protein